jgi:hypothetical protein
MIAGFRVDKLRVDANAISAALNAAFEDIANVQLTADLLQIDGPGLTPIIKSDRRFKNGGAHEAVETEALSQRLIVQIVRDRLEELLPEPLSHFLDREQVEREHLRVLLGRTS